MNLYAHCFVWIFFFQNHQILDINADRSNIHMLLEGIQISIDELQTQSFQFKTYQKNFKVSMALYSFAVVFVLFSLDEQN